MNRILVRTTGAALILASFAFSAVKIDYDHSTNFERYHTFAWKLPAQTPSNGIADNSMVANRIEQAVNQALTSKGLQQASTSPDLNVVYHVGAKNQKDLEYFPSWGPGFRRGRWGGGGWYGGDVFVNRYVKGSVVVDLIDARTNQLVFRAFLTDTGSTLTDVQSSKAIGKMVNSAFKHFPPKAA